MFKTRPNDDGLLAFIDICSAAAAHRAPLKITRVRNGPALVVLQPHPDDAALSIGGLLARLRRDVTLLTIFGGSRGGIRDLRESEDFEFARLVNAHLCYLNYPESTSSGEMADAEPILRTVRARLPSRVKPVLLFAP